MAEVGITAGQARQAQRRVVRVLAIGQFFNGLAVAIGVAMTPLAAARLSGSVWIGGLASTCLVTGTAISALPLARIASRYGRRPALTIGLGLAACGSAIAVIAASAHAWLPLLAGVLTSGAGSAASYATRYAATDLAEPSRRGSALALVVWPTTGGVVLGPNLLAPAERLSGAVGLTPLAGPFAVAGLGFAISTALLFIWLRPDPLLLAKSMALIASQDEATARGGRPGTRPLAAMLASPRIRWCIYALAAGHAVMIALMIMEPVTMQQHMFPLSTIGMVVSGHLFGMYAFSPVVGWLTDRFGAPILLVAGLVTMAVAALLALAAGAGHPLLIAVSLFLLGVGWSGDVVAGSALLTDVAPIADRPVVQGVSDLAMDVGGALAGLAAGLVVSVLSFGALALAVVGLVAVLLPFQMRTLGPGWGRLS
jgi:MFS family permease